MGSISKLTYAILLIFILEVAMYLFAGTEYSNTSLFGMILGEGSILSSALFTSLLLIIGGIAAATIISGNFININIYAIYAAMIVVLIKFVQTILAFGNLITSELETVLSPEMMLAVWSILIGPLIIFYVISCIEWIRSNQ